MVGEWYSPQAGVTIAGWGCYMDGSVQGALRDQQSMKQVVGPHAAFSLSGLLGGVCSFWVVTRSESLQVSARKRSEQVS
jgi:hypothetical protein